MEWDIKNLAGKIALSRRNVIKLIIGGAAGTTLTPLPWKLTDDIAIWTQNWPWLPVPPEGAVSHASSICQLCPGGCGIEVRRVDGRAVKIDGRLDYPVNPGGVCPLGEGGLQLLYNENIRFTGPMKRVGSRGSGEYMPVSWDDALEELADRIKTLRHRGNPEALVAVDGNPSGSSLSLLAERLLTAVGSPNYIRIPSAEDTHDMAHRLMMGSESPMAYDLENADFILSFGCSLIDGWGAPGRMLNAWGLWHGDPLRGKINIVQIESMASKTASKADLWLAPVPGTEAALALGLAHVIIKEGLYDRTFIENYSFGFEDWVDASGKRHLGFKTLVLEKYGPGSVAQMTRLNARDILSLARAFSRSKKPIALCGKGKGNLNGSLFEFMAIQSLNALLGNINKPGGVLIHEQLPFSPWPDVELDPVALEGLKKPRIDQAGSVKFPFSRWLINNLADAVLEQGQPPVDTLLIFSGNPAYNLPDGGIFRSAMKKIPYIVSFSPFRDESAYMADLILPDHTYLEKINDVVWPRGLQYPLYGLSQAVVEPLYDTRNSGDVLIQLARKVSDNAASSFPWNDFETSMKARAKGLFQTGGGMTRYDGSNQIWKKMERSGFTQSNYQSFDEMWKKLRTSGLWYHPSHNFGNWASLFKTPSGKFEFFSRSLEKAVQDAARGNSFESALMNLHIGARGDEAFMPHFEPAPPGGHGDTKDEEYPLQMLPYELINLSSGWAPNPPYLNKTLLETQLRKDESFVDINPHTAATYSLKQGDRVTIQSPQGKIDVRVNLFEGAMPGVLYLLAGLGHTAYDAFQRNKGVNPNDIVTGGKDPLSGQMIWWNTRVKLIKA